MPDTVGSLAVELGLDLAKFENSARQVPAITSQHFERMSAEMKRTTREGAESLRLVDEALGIHLSRPLTRIIAQIPGVGTALQSILGGAAFGAFAVAGVEFFDKMTEKITHAQKAEDELLRSTEKAEQTFGSLMAGYEKAGTLRSLTGLKKTLFEVDSSSMERAIKGLNELDKTNQEAAAKAAAAAGIWTHALADIGNSWDSLTGKTGIESTIKQFEAFKKILDDIAIANQSTPLKGMQEALKATESAAKQAAAALQVMQTMKLSGTEQVLSAVMRIGGGVGIIGVSEEQIKQQERYLRNLDQIVKLMQAAAKDNTGAEDEVRKADAMERQAKAAEALANLQRELTGAAAKLRPEPTDPTEKLKAEIARLEIEVTGMEQKWDNALRDMRAAGASPIALHFATAEIDEVRTKVEALLKSRRQDLEMAAAEAALPATPQALLNPPPAIPAPPPSVTPPTSQALEAMMVAKRAVISAPAPEISPAAPITLPAPVVSPAAATALPNSIISPALPPTAPAMPTLAPGGLPEAQLDQFSSDAAAKMALVKKAEEDATTPLQKYAEQVARINIAFQGVTEPALLAVKVDALSKAWDDYTKTTTKAEEQTLRLEKQMEKLEAQADSMAAGVASAFTQLQMSTRAGLFGKELSTEAISGFEDNTIRMLEGLKVKWDQYFRSLETMALKFAMNRALSTVGSGVMKRLGIGQDDAKGKGDQMAVALQNSVAAEQANTTATQNLTAAITGTSPGVPAASGGAGGGTWNAAEAPFASALAPAVKGTSMAPFMPMLQPLLKETTGTSSFTSMLGGQAQVPGTSMGGYAGAVMSNTSELQLATAAIEKLTTTMNVSSGSSALGSGSSGGAGDENGGGDLLQSLLSSLTPHAGGGDVTPGQGYLVGEEGPEPFFPSVAGQILPSSSMKGGGDTHQHFYDFSNFKGDAALMEAVKAMVESRSQQAEQRAVIQSNERSRRMTSGA